MSTQASAVVEVKPAQVCLILGLALILAGSVVGLAALDKDVASIFAALAAVAITIGGSFGWAKVNQITKDLGNVNQNVNHVKELSNGRLTDMMETIKQQQDKITELAMLVQPPASSEEDRK